jgi:putative MATE family efflux protein
VTHGITEGPLGRAVFRLAWPVIVAESLHTAFHIVDIIWIRALGPNATAAATTATFAAWLILALSSLVTTGVTAHVSQAIGSGDRPRAARAATQAFHLATLLGLSIAAVGWWAAPAIFALIGGTGELHRLGTLYLRAVALGAPATLLYLLGAAIMRASGNTRLPMLITASAVAANVGLAPLFVYVLDLGLVGAPIATIVCMFGAATAYLQLVARAHPDLPFDRTTLLRLDPARMASITRVGAPYAILAAGFSAVYLAYSHYAAALGVVAVAIVGLGNRLEALCYIPSDGFGAAAATIVGQNLGAGRPERAARGAWTAVGAMTLVSLPLTLAMWFLPELLLSLFSDDRTLISRGADYVRILGLCQLAVGVEGTLGGAFAGAGDTLPPLAFHLSFAVLRIPLGALAVDHFGLEGIAITLSATCFLRATLLALWFRRNAWQRGGVIP